RPCHVHYAGAEQHYAGLVGPDFWLSPHGPPHVGREFRIYVYAGVGGPRPGHGVSPAPLALYHPQIRRRGLPAVPRLENRPIRSTGGWPATQPSFQFLSGRVISVGQSQSLGDGRRHYRHLHPTDRVLLESDDRGTRV